MDLKKYDKDGNLLNLTKAYDRNDKATGSNYYEWYKNDPSQYEPTADDLKCELQLNLLGDFEALSLRPDVKKFKDEVKTAEFVPYLRREGVSNDREGILLVGLEGDKPTDSLSRPEAMKRAGRVLKETDFDTPTSAYSHFESLRPILDYWSGLGRTMIVKTNKGGWFPPHRDSPLLTRDSFRVICFLGNSDTNSYEWWLGDSRRTIIPNTTYYVDTTKVHRTHSWMDNSFHLILNVPKTWENVIKLTSILENP